MAERDAPRYVPPGWPPEVNPPSVRDWETTAAAWPLDLVLEYGSTQLCGGKYGSYQALGRQTATA